MDLFLLLDAFEKLILVILNSALMVSWFFIVSFDFFRLNTEESKTVYNTFDLGR